MRLMTYNILEGLGLFSDKDGVLEQSERVDRLKVLLKDHAPDVLVLNEALFCEELDGFHIDYARLLDFPYVHTGMYDRHWGNVILSKYPILERGELKFNKRSGLHVVIEVDEDTHINVATYHPHPDRLPINKSIDFASMAMEIEGPGLICGDFNCINPEHDFDYPSLLDSFKRFSGDLAEHKLDRFIVGGRRVFPMLQEMGFSDVFTCESDRQSTMPTGLVGAPDDPGMKIDHILANDGINTENVVVIINEDTDLISDHYPLLYDFSVRTEECDFESTYNTAPKREEYGLHI